MVDHWNVSINNHNYGSYPRNEIVELSKNVKLRPNDLIWSFDAKYACNFLDDSCFTIDLSNIEVEHTFDFRKEDYLIMLQDIVGLAKYSYELERYS